MTDTQPTGSTPTPSTPQAATATGTIPAPQLKNVSTSFRTLPALPDTSLPWDPEFDIEAKDVSRCLFFGLGADGTGGANKNSIKIIAEETDNYAQGYFVYDSKKSGAVTISHLRFGPRQIRSAYLIRKANFIACHQTSFLDKYPMLELSLIHISEPTRPY